MSHAKGFVTLVDEAKSHIKEITVHDLIEKRQRGDAFELIDVREESEFALGAIPDAMHVSKGLIECVIEKALPDKSTQVVLYCGGGFRSALAAVNLQKMGYTDVLSLEGGYKAWQQHCAAQP